MTVFAVQYLESPFTEDITPEKARSRMRAAFERLPISMVLLGGNLHPVLKEACAEETSRLGARLYLWQPLLTGGGDISPQPSWQTVGLDGLVVPGFQNLAEFTFMCANKPEVQQFILKYLEKTLQNNQYQGVFLDRIRYPSPTADPSKELACFCDACRSTAEKDGLDLEAVRRTIQKLLASEQGARILVQCLLHPRRDRQESLDLLHAFLDFRQRSIYRFVLAASKVAEEQGITIGLDCFSPSISRMVGQDLNSLNTTTKWIKIMTYTHALGPSGLPYELLGLTKWLMSRYGLSEYDAIKCLADATSLPLPNKRTMIRDSGLSPETIILECKCGRDLGIENLLLGLAMVDIPGVHQVSNKQLVADLTACQKAHVDGIVLSWDLWKIPLERLILVSNLFLPS